MEFSDSGMDLAEMDLEDTYTFPFVCDKTSPDSGHSEYIISSGSLDIDISEQIGEWESIAICSPVLEAWGRWEPDIKHSVDRVLCSFSGNKARIEKITDYMKGRMIKIAPDDLFGLIRLADMLLIYDLFNYCKDRITGLPITKDNFYKVLYACSIYDLEHEQMDKYIRGNLIELSTEAEISKIDAESVEMLLTEEELCYWPMENRFETVRDWCAAHGSITFFERWFHLLNLNKLDKEYIENAVKGNPFVKMSDKCLRRVNNHLTFKEDKPVPFVFLLDDDCEGSNVVGVNLEDMHLYRFNFPESIMDTISIPRTNVTGEILTFNISKRRIYAYDINRDTCKEKRIANKVNISHIIETNKSPVIISTEEGTLDDENIRYKGARDRYKRISVLYQTVSDNEKVLHIEPLMSLVFEVCCACYNHSMIVMSTSTYSLRSKFYCFSLQTNKMTEINLPFNYIFYEQLVVKSFLPIHDKILVATRSSFMFLSIDKATGVYKLDEKTRLNIAPPLYGNPRYIIFSDFLVELNEKSVLLYHNSKEQNSFKELNSSELKTLNISHYKHITCGYVKRTKPICHFLCPHCDPDAKEKEEAEILRQVEEMRERNRILYHNFPVHDFDDYYESYSDEYDDDTWNQTEMIWDGSADEFVEAWW